VPSSSRIKQFKNKLFLLGLLFIEDEDTTILAVPGATHPVTWCHIHDTPVLSHAIGFLKTV
jgi:hypothetical protein